MGAGRTPARPITGEVIWFGSAGWVAVLPWGLGGLLAAVALLLLGRRLAGALLQPLPAVVLLSCALIAVAMAFLIRLGTISGGSWRRNGSALMLHLMATASLAALAASLSLGDTSRIGLLLLWAPILLEEGAAWALLFREQQRSGTMAAASNNCPIADSSHAPQDESPPDAELEEEAREADDVLADQDVQLSMLRRVTGEAERVSGWFRLTFAAGQRTATSHLAFCPSMSSAPRIVCQQLDGPEARIKVAQALPYGARLDVKLLEAADEPLTVAIEFVAQCDTARH